MTITAGTPGVAPATPCNWAVATGSVIAACGAADAGDGPRVCSASTGSIRRRASGRTSSPIPTPRAASSTLAVGRRRRRGARDRARPRLAHPGAARRAVRTCSPSSSIAVWPRSSPRSSGPMPPCEVRVADAMRAPSSGAARLGRARSAVGVDVRVEPSVQRRGPVVVRLLEEAAAVERHRRDRAARGRRATRCAARAPSTGRCR